MDGWIVNAIKALYADATAVVKLKNGVSKEFPLTVGFRQGSVLSPLLFNNVLETLSKEFKVGLPWELLYADDLVLLTESEKVLVDQMLEEGIGRKRIQGKYG